MLSELQNSLVSCNRIIFYFMFVIFKKYVDAGIDASGYRSTQAASNEYDTGSPPVTDEERFQSCEK